MTTVAAILSFAAAAAVLTLTPGLDTALVLRTTTVAGARPGGYAAIGILIGCLFWGAAASVGLATVLAASKIAFTILKWAGAAYLFWVGTKLITSPRKSFDIGNAAVPENGHRAALSRGLFTNLLNPKMGVFYISFLPQFIPAGVNVAVFSLLLACIHALLGLIWFIVLIAATVPIGRVLRQPAIVRRMDRTTGAIFLLFGAKLALTKS